MKVIDEINNEILTINDFYDAYREVISRVKFHNSEFDYNSTGRHHYSQNAEYKLNRKENEFVIRRKER